MLSLIAARMVDEFRINPEQKGRVESYLQDVVGAVLADHALTDSHMKVKILNQRDSLRQLSRACERRKTQNRTLREKLLQSESAVAMRKLEKRVYDLEQAIKAAKKPKTPKTPKAARKRVKKTAVRANGKTDQPLAA